MADNIQVAMEVKSHLIHFSAKIASCRELIAATVDKFPMLDENRLVFCFEDDKGNKIYLDDTNLDEAKRLARDLGKPFYVIALN